MITEAQLEQLAIQWFQDTGWSYANGPVISPEGEAPEREDFRAVIRQLLRKYKFPPDGQEEAIVLVLKQAEQLADAWTRG